MIGQRIFALLSGLVDGRVYPRVAPLDAATPYITFQRVGGRTPSFLGREAPATSNARVQVSIWGYDSVVVAQLADDVADAFTLTNTFIADPLGAAIEDYEPDTDLYGSRQDFSCWWDR